MIAGFCPGRVALAAWSHHVDTPRELITQSKSEGLRSNHRTMKKPTITQLSSLAVLPCLLSLSNEASAAVACSPTAMVSGSSVSLQGNCIEDTTGMPLTSGNEVWHIDASGSTSPVGMRLIPGGTLTVPALPGEHTYFITAIDNGYGGTVNLGGEGGYPQVTVTLTCAGEPPPAAGAAPSRASAQRVRRHGHECDAAVATEVGAPLMTLQSQRLRRNLDEAHARMRRLRSAGSLPGLDVQGVPLPARKDADAGPREQRLGVYVLGLGDYLRQDRSDTQSGFKLRGTAVSVGADYRLSDAWVMGANVGGSQARIDFADSDSEQKSRGRQLTAYASWSFSPSAYVSATLSHESTRHELQRDDGEGGFAHAQPHGKGLGLSVSAGRDLVFGAWSIGPYLRYDSVTTRVEAYEESGTDAALAVGAQRVRSDTFNVGAQAQMSVPVSWGIVLPYLRVELTHRRDRTRDEPGATLVNGNTAVLLPNSADTRSSHGNVALGVSGLHQGGVSWFADVETGVAQKGYRSQRVGLGLRFEL